MANQLPKMKITFKRPTCLRPTPFHYCPGCHHGLVHRLIAEVIDELQLRDDVIGIAPVGCAVIAYDYFDFDMLEVAHGRCPAAATAIKRVRPQNIVFSYQGDGDLAAIGTAEIIHTANRGENITVIMINNTVYGMTGGQMSPTTIPGQKTQTTSQGKLPQQDGYPLRIAELLATLEAPAYICRVAVNNPANLIKAKKAIRQGFKLQQAQKGFSLIEVLSACPVNWRLSPVAANKWLQEELISYFPLGVFKERN